MPIVQASAWRFHRGVYSVQATPCGSQKFSREGGDFLAILDALKEFRVRSERTIGQNWWLAVGAMGLLVLLAAVWRNGSPAASRQVVVYTALDEEFSRPVFELFTRRTGIEVLGKFDTESTKTVGLTQAILAERARPRCDLFWNNEIVNTLRLEQAALLSAFHPSVAEAYPEQYRSTKGMWYGFAARARVLLVNTDLVAEEDWPTSIVDLTQPKWKDRVGIAKPLAGTTASHAACLFAVWGELRAREFFESLKANVRIMAGNKQVAREVARGGLAFGLTDTDDAIIEVEAGWPVKIIYPDQGDQQLGTLFIPNTLAIIRGAPHPREAEALVEFLLSAEVERMLAEGPSAQIPLSTEVQESPRVGSPQTVRAMQVDFQSAASSWNQAASYLRERFATAD